MGKAEGPHGWSEQDSKKEKKWHGHVTAVTVAPDFRRLGIATKLMDILELVTEKKYAYFVISFSYKYSYAGFFVDLFVRESNKVAIEMYKKLGYSVYRKVLNYYQDEGRTFEDGLGILVATFFYATDMRKATLSLDPDKKTEIPLGRDITVDELDSTL